MTTIKKAVLIVFLFLCVCHQVAQDAQGADRGLELGRALDELAEELTDRVSTRDRITIGVADFWDLNQRTTGLGRYIGEEMATRLHGSKKKVRVIESRMLNEVVMELCANQTDLFDQGATRGFGKFTGADALLVGTITVLDTTVRVNARLISTESRDSLAAAAVSVTRDGRVDSLLAYSFDNEVALTKKCQDAFGRQKMAEPEVVEASIAGTVFENELLRVTVKSFQRSKGRLVLEVWYENLTEETITLASSGWGSAYSTDHSGTYLLSDGGEKWIYKEDAQVGSRYGGTELLPGQRLLNSISFKPENGAVGSRFTYTGKFRISWRNAARRTLHNEEVRVILRDLAPEVYGKNAR